MYYVQSYVSQLVGEFSMLYLTNLDPHLREHSVLTSMQFHVFEFYASAIATKFYIFTDNLWNEGRAYY